jgi:hypothetical protein
MIGNPVGRGDLELPADLRDRRGKALFPNGLEQKIVDCFLPDSQRGKHNNHYILKLISVVNRAANKASSASLRSPTRSNVLQTYASARRPSRASQLNLLDRSMEWSFRGIKTEKESRITFTHLSYGTPAQKPSSRSNRFSRKLGEAAVRLCDFVDFD